MKLVQPSSMKFFLLISAGLIIVKPIVEGIWHALRIKDFFEFYCLKEANNTRFQYFYLFKEGNRLKVIGRNTVFSKSKLCNNFTVEEIENSANQPGQNENHEIGKRKYIVLRADVFKTETYKYAIIRKLDFLGKAVLLSVSHPVELLCCRTFFSIGEYILKPIVSSAIACAAFTFFPVSRPNLAKVALASTICLAVPNIFNEISEKFKGNSR